ncbi:hypothetical protein LCGC14_1980020 [marine sediment metagenome]|uniref:Uncharacterized protein n=1 Tax=marine sediment metagenome TaxID=412755 RepID=A0A0F9I658_9ZZZZ
MEEQVKIDFFKKLDKALLEDYKEEIKAFGEEANQPSVLSELLRMGEDYGKTLNEEGGGEMEKDKTESKSPFFKRLDKELLKDYKKAITALEEPEEPT